MKTELGKWLEFNDSRVKLFEFSKLESECFGGVNESASSDEYVWSWKTSSSQSAYMLVYERRVKNDIKFIIPEEKKEEQPMEDVEEKTKSDEKEDGEEQTPTLVCDDTAESRVATTTKDGYQIHYNEDKKESYYNVDFYSHQKKRTTPIQIFKNVWDDNNLFLFERQIYSSEFFNFLLQTLKTVDKSVSDFMIAEAEQKLERSIASNENLMNVYKGVVKVGSKFVIEVLSRALSNSAIKPITELLMKMYSDSEEACMEFMKYVLQDNGKEVLHILFKCKDKEVRRAVSKLLTTVVIRLFKIEEKYLFETETYEIITDTGEKKDIEKPRAMSMVFLELCFAQIGYELGQCWTRFEQFFEMLSEVCITPGEEMVQYLYDKNIIALLIDFFLGTSSPLYQPGEKRYQMGNKWTTPKLDSLVNLVSYLVLHAATDIITSESSPEVLEKVQNFKLGSKFYEMSELDKKCFYHNNTFITKSLKEGYAPQSFANLISYWSFDNMPYSRTVAKILLQGMNDSEYNEIKPYFTVLKPFLCLRDSVEQLRIEWLLGFGQLTTTSSAFKPKESKYNYGLAHADHITDDVFIYNSTLTYNNSNDSLLYLLWRYKKRYENYTMSCLRYLFSIMLENYSVLFYVTNTPPPTYQFSDYTGWIKTFTTNYAEEYKRFYASSSWGKDKEQMANETLANLEKYNQIIEEYKDSSLLNKFVTNPYLIGKSISEKVLSSETAGDITVDIIEITTEVYKSIPTGVNNQGIPKTYFNKVVNKYGILKNGEKAHKNLSINIPKQTETTAPMVNILNY